MKTYLCDYNVATFSTIEAVVEGAFPEAVVRCEDVNEDFFEAHIYFADDLDMLDDIMAEFEWVSEDEWED